MGKSKHVVGKSDTSFENYWGPIIKQYFKVGWMLSQPSLASEKLLVVLNIINNINMSIMISLMSDRNIKHYIV